MIPDPASYALLRAPFFFLRHGETEPNRLGLATGMTDVPLNDAGRRQAEAAARALAGRGVNAIFSSPLRRARDTAEYVAQQLGLPISIVDDIAERNWGEFEGQPKELRVWGAQPRGGEGLDEFTQRTLRGLARIPGGGRTLVVAHSGTFRVLCASLGLPHRGPQVGNAHPLHLRPPDMPDGKWVMEPLARA
jgi:broad specificity phosphatase PhoE